MNVLEKLAERAPDLAFELPDGTAVVKLGLIITLYFKEGYTLETKLKIDECFAKFYEHFQPQLKSMVYRRFKKLTDAGFSKARQQILETEPNDQFSWFLGSASKITEASDYSLSMLNSFAVHGDLKRSYIKLIMPWSILKEPKGRTQYEEWLVYLCNQISAEHGHGGLSSILPYDYFSYMPTEFELAQQYCGLDVDSTAHISTLELTDHIKGVNWYTIIG
uniref:type VI immunity family protein n=1 Tax=Pseudomonas syringae TaxID=317 RepID=UPI000465B7AC